jgi:SRSO17 transposase
MTAPTFANWVTLLGGWLFAPRRTITGMLIAANVSGKRHHASFHRVFSNGRWSLDVLGLAVLRLILSLGLVKGTVVLGLDDTLARKRGRKIFGVGMHHDPLISSRRTAIVNRGHSWVVVGVIVELAFAPGFAYCLPILFRVYVNKKAAKEMRYRTRPELAVEMLTLLARAFPERRFHVVADSGYAGESVVARLPERFDFTGRIHFDAQLFGQPAPRRPGRPGRTAFRGKRLPSPRRLLAKKRGKLVSFDIYGRRERARLVVQDCLWYRVTGTRPIRVVGIEPMTSGRKPQAFYSTDITAEAVEILRRYALRWSLEVAFHDSKQSLGFEEPQGWSRAAVLRTAPTAMLLYSLVIVWFAKRRRKDRVALPRRPWYTLRRRASFADMLATLKRESVHEHILSRARRGAHVPKSLQTLVIHCAGAA